MQFKNIIVATTLAASAVALPATASGKTAFNVVAIDSGSAVQYKSFGATKGSLLAGLTTQNATCEGSVDNINSATFYIDNGALYLYNDGNSAAQKFYVDSSGMGQGIIKYTSDSDEVSSNGELTGWAISESYLQFGGKDLIACPNSIEGSWSIWADAGVSNPGQNKDCVGIVARVGTNSNPNSCVYTE
ncbi:hypothetical protein N7495_009161 [Penicillium taxi]|uniref:uncharacterized protein n=1 Tax=Penicillium taxi TaxID=168475 RepID=UPI0025451374|nr:uncharacterized protein N7495_009161 [Penicillium taxi]KAJ5884651.1 hypothetical protein N7495_009161 [Penicillium taxi]